MSFLRLEIVYKDKFDSVNLYFQDESRFGLKTFVGRCLSMVGVRGFTYKTFAYSSFLLYDICVIKLNNS